MGDSIDDRFLHDLLDRDGKLSIQLSWKEAVLLDYLLTASSMNEDVLRFLDASRHIRDEVGYVLLGHRDYIMLSQEDTDLLRKLVSPIFPMGGEQVGERLKVKLHGALLGHSAPPVPEKPSERSQEV